MMKPVLAIYGIKDRFIHEYPAYTHDHNLAFMVDGKVEKYIHLERYTRRKNDNRLDVFMEAIIEEELGGLSEDFDFAAVNSFVGNAFVSANGRLRIEAPGNTELMVAPQKAAGWFQCSPWEGHAPDSWMVPHELAHVFSNLPFFGNFNNNSLLIHFDGGASVGNFSAFHFVDNKIVKLEHHWALSHLSKLYNDNALSFLLMKAKPGAHCSVPGKFMGYAAMGTPYPALESWLRENNFFKDIWQDQSPFYQQARKMGWNGSLENNDDKFLMDVAASVQSVFQKEIIQKIKTLQQQTRADYLYYSGGCALNIMTNSKLVFSGLFKDVFIPPACNDSGLSLGAAAFVNWSKGNPVQAHGAYLNNYKTASGFKYSMETVRLVAEEIMAGKIIGICNGNGEAGPRALGNRSIVARADDKQIARKVSMDCKGREWFRPVAPVMLERNAREVTGLAEMHHLSRFMLLDFPVLPEYRTKLEGVVHQNNTARIQTVFQKSENSFLYDLLDFLHVNYGQLALINTSFNRRGEPIVQTRQDAIDAAGRLHLDGLVFNGAFKKQYQCTGKIFF